MSCKYVTVVQYVRTVVPGTPYKVPTAAAGELHTIHDHRRRARGIIPHTLNTTQVTFARFSTSFDRPILNLVWLISKYVIIYFIKRHVSPQ